MLYSRLSLAIWSIDSSVHHFNADFSALGLPWWVRLKRICQQCRRPRFNPWVKKIPREENGNPLQYPAWEIPRTEESGGLQSAGSQSRTRLSN